MKTTERSPGKLILALLTLLAFGYLFYDNLSYYVHHDYPLVSKATFQYVDKAVVDTNSNLYRIDQSRHRITKTSSQGRVEFVATCDPIKEKSLFADIAVGDQDQAYIKKIYVDASGSLVTREEILEYSTQDLWAKPRVLKTLEYAPDSYIESPGQISGLKYQDGYLYSFIRKEQSVVLSRYNIKSGKEDKLNTDIPAIYDPAAVTCQPPETICFTTRQGEVFRTKINSGVFESIQPHFIGDYNQWQQGVLTSSSAGRSVNYSNPALIAIDNKQNLYLADQGQRTINYLFSSPVSLISDPAANSANGINKNEPQGLEVVSNQTKAAWYKSTVLNESGFRGLLAKEKLPDTNLITESITAGPDGTLTCVISDQVLIIKDNDNQQKLVSAAQPQAKYSQEIQLVNLIMWVLPIILGIALLYCLKRFYLCYLRRKIIRKQIGLFIMVMLLVQIAVTYITNMQIDYILTHQIETQLTNRVNTAVSGLSRYYPINGGFSSYLNDLQNIHGPQNYQDAAYRSLSLYLQQNQDDTAELQKEKSAGEMVGEVYKSLASLSTGKFKLDTVGDEYSIIYLVEEYQPGQHVFHYWVTDDAESSFTPCFIPNQRDLAQYDKAINNNQSVFFTQLTDAQGKYIFMIKPFKYMTPYGERTALYEAGMERTALTNYESAIYRNTFGLVLIILIACTGLIYFLTYKLLLPLRQLKQGVEMMDGKRWKNELHIKTGDEMESLANSFNSMNANLKKHIKDIEDTQKAYARFVPDEIKKYLNKKSIVNIALRDNNRVSMGVMIVNIRDFYSLSKTMSAQENFDFINTFLERVGPAVPNYNGFINEFTGFGLMSLFPEGNQAEDCIAAALEMQAAAQHFSEEQVLAGREAFAIGISAHICPDLILGIVGFQMGREDRYQATVMHEGVVLTGLLEKMGPKVGASIIVTESIINRLPERHNYRARYLGLFSFDSIHEPVHLYDLYQNDPNEIKNMKERTKADFERGVKLYQEQQFEDAKYIFIDIIGVNNRDEAAKIYFYLCDEYAKNLPRSWSPAINIG